MKCDKLTQTRCREYCARVGIMYVEAVMERTKGKGPMLDSHRKQEPYFRLTTDVV